MAKKEYGYSRTDRGGAAKLHKKLTIRLEDEVIEDLKEYCKEHKISVQRFVEDYIIQTLTDR